MECKALFLSQLKFISDLPCLQLHSIAFDNLIQISKVKIAT